MWMIYLSLCAQAQQQSVNPTKTPTVGAIELPIGFAPRELLIRDQIPEMSRETSAPPGPVRNIAEFEPMSGVLIRYPFGIPVSLIVEMSEDVTIYCLVSSSQQSMASTILSAAGVEDVQFIVGDTDSMWTRDYGPWWVVDGTGQVAVVDHTYNRPRPNDNDAPLKVSEHLDTAYYASDIITAGGNYMTEGQGISASSALVVEENPDLSIDEIETLMFDYYGIENYHIIEDPNNTYIDHIDCWGKFLSPNKVLLRQVPESHPQHIELEEVATYFEEIVNSSGQLWEVFRVQTPGDEPYTNSLILNDKVLVPITSDPPNSFDQAALETYELAMPGYDVVGFTGSWQSTDALHCRVKGIPDLHMLQIFHTPVSDSTSCFSQGHVVQATVDDLSETGLIDIAVWWKNEDMAEYEAIEMAVCEIDIPDCYDATIPFQTTATTIDYYVFASDGSGRSETLPMAGSFSFDVDGVEYTPGDVNTDGLVDILDIITTMTFVLNQASPDPLQFESADLTCDGTLNVLDLIALVTLIVEA